jgi:ABC-type bacteriocin/lantibiotic exporter with double-glycine peptidase domain
MNRHTIGNPEIVLTLISTEVDRIIGGLKWLHEYWANLVQAAVATYLLQSQLPNSFAYLAPLILVLLSSAISALNSRLANTQQARWITAVKERIGLTTHMLQNMKGVRLRALEALIREQIAASRVHELSKALGYRVMELYAAILGFVPQLFGPTFALLTIIVQNKGQPLSATVAFTTIALINIMANPLTVSLQMLPETVAVFGCLRRIEDYLRLDEHLDTRKMHNSSQVGSTDALVPTSPRENIQSYKILPVSRSPMALQEDPLLLSVRNCSIGHTQDRVVLKDVNFNIRRKSFTIIAGPVGSGKTTLCRALLGECVSTGGIHWMISVHDVAYCEQQSFMVNASIRDNITSFEIYDHDWYQTVITACALLDDFAAFPLRDRTLVGSAGSGISGGQKQRIALARALYARKRVIILDDILSGLDADSERHVIEHAIGPHGLARSYGATVILATHATRWLPLTDHIIVLGRDGAIEAQGRYADISSQIDLSGTSYSQDVSELMDQSKTPHEPTTGKSERSDGPLLGENSTNGPGARVTGNMAVYAFYARAAGSHLVCCLITACALAAVTWTMPSYWLELWTDPSRTWTLSQLLFWTVYAIFQVFTLALICLAFYAAFIGMVTRAGTNSHNRLLDAVVNAPWSPLSSMDIGSIINHFSQDIELMDIELPTALLNFQFVAFLGIAQTTLIVISSPWVGVGLPVLAAVVFAVQKFYLRTSRQLRLIDLEARAPLFTYVVDLVQGLSTYRAFNRLSQYERNGLRLLEKSQEPRYLLSMVQLWLTFVLDAVVACVAVAVVTVALRLRGGSGPTGLALTQIMSLSSSIRNAVIYWTSLETSVGAVHRIRNFTEKATSEHRPEECIRPSSSWPQSGEIRIENLTASYRYVCRTTQSSGMV